MINLADQCLGTNAEANTELTTLIRQYMASVTGYANIAARISAKYKDYYFPFVYSKEKWDEKIISIIRKFDGLATAVKLAAEFEGGTAEGTFKEEWSGSDHDKTTRNPVKSKRTFTDNLQRQNITKFAGVGDTDTERLAEKTVTTPVDGLNTQTEETEQTFDGTDDVEHQKGTVRTYSDGRTAEERIAAALDLSQPVQDFINAFSAVLLSPREWRENFTCYGEDFLIFE